MPYKTGGGGKPELYDKKTGEYTDEEKKTKNASDLETIMHRYFLDEKSFSVSFPNYKWNDKEYCDLYIKFFNEQKNIKRTIEMPKMKYLLSFREKDDKSMFLKEKLGYDENQLYNDINNNTDFKTMLFSDLNEYGLKVVACTKLKSQLDGKEYLVSSVWQITKDHNIRFITLYPGGEKIWNFISTKK